MKYQILDMYSSIAQFELECDSLRECVVAAVNAGANLSGADLSGANLGEEKGTLVGGGYFSCGPQGSRNDYLQAFHTNNGIWVKAGCFFDLLEKFREEVCRTHGEKSKHGKVYLSIADLIGLKFSEDTTEDHWDKVK